MTATTYQIRSTEGVENFSDPTDAAKHWHGLSDPIARVFIVQNGRLRFGAFADVKPVYDALAELKSA